MKVNIIGLDEVARRVSKKTLNHPHRYGSSRHRTFSTPLKNAKALRYPSLLSQPSFRTIAVLKGFTAPGVIDILEKVWNTINDLEEANPDKDYSFLKERYNLINPNQSDILLKLTQLEALVEVYKRYPNESVIKSFQSVESQLEDLKMTGKSEELETRFWLACRVYLQEPHDVIKFYGSLLSMQNEIDNQQRKVEQLPTSLYKKLTNRFGKKSYCRKTGGK